MSETEAIDKLFLELSQFTQAKTNKEYNLEVALMELRDAGQTIVRHKHQCKESLWHNLANAVNRASQVLGSPGR